MRFEVLRKEDMNALSRELSRAGIMNRTREEVTPDISHYVVVEGTYAELVEKAAGIGPLGENLDELKLSFQEIMENWEPGQEKELDELLDESDLGRLLVLKALMESGQVVEEDGKLVLVKEPVLDNLKVELRFPIEVVEEYIEELEKHFETRMITEYVMEKRYFVEVVEVDRELIETALEIAGEYATEESVTEAMFDGIARSVLAGVVVKLAEKHGKKKELIEALLEREPIVVESGGGRLNVYFDEDAVEDFLKELQRLGYLKIKGNRVWV
ncbi:hypothetical protein A3L02_04640 [Thermococcus celer Vu 13 = JCM 8558]|uniref:Uncharacterized protein n=1 Tax=Thermococcus celer Vu 13 = JCM 8558 TaxID=1293037 RepID=A0A218P1U2_THECE|nr:hypothetical protein [Thermococcus celer]ASI98896.1 hypothetical protein A3L02_04640 [Thermococcus celer Vu 13 = JCM 8558]